MTQRRPGRGSSAKTTNSAADGLVLHVVRAPSAAARPLLDRALSIDEAVHGPDHPDVATTLSNLATVLHDLGQPGDARPLLERALTITENVYGPNNPNAKAIREYLAIVRQRT